MGTETLQFKSINLFSFEGAYFRSILCSEYEKILSYYPDEKAHDSQRLHDFQRLPANFFQHKSNFNSLLVYHQTGLGKTRTTVEMVNNITTFAHAVNVVVICPAVLKNTAWLPTLKHHLRDKRVLNSVHFVSVDSPNFNNDFDVVIKSITFNIPTIVVIDECHIFISSLVEETSNRRLVYHSLLDLMKHYKVFLLCLSATPLVNKVEELIYLFNLLRPNTFHNKHELFSKLFINGINGKLKNQDTFCKRITGLVSFFEMSKKEGMPVINAQVIKLKMPPLQAESYRFIESEEISLKGGYKQKTIAACNFTLPLNVLKSGVAVNLKQFIEAAPEQQLQEMSPKFVDIISKIKTSKRTNLVHSSYIRTTIVPFELYLEREGFSRFTDETQNNYKCFCTVFGEVSTEERDRILQIWNNKENAYGKFIKVIIISDVFSAGVTIKWCENVFKLNRHWNSAKPKQVDGRVARFTTHSDLPVEERFVNNYTYIMYRDKGETADEHLEKTSIQKDAINDMFLHLIKISSIDIDFNKSNPNFTYRNVEPFRVSLNHFVGEKPFINKHIMDDEGLIQNNVMDMVITKKETRLVRVSFTDKHGVKKVLSCLLLFPTSNYFLLDTKYYNYIGFIKTENERPLFDSDNGNCFVAEIIL